jgi:hypothetical protein
LCKRFRKSKGLRADLKPAIAFEIPSRVRGVGLHVGAKDGVDAGLIAAFPS